MKKFNLGALLKNTDVIFDGLGTLAGLLTLIQSFVIKASSVGSFEASKSYGGDAYTGMQNASAQAANNVLAGNRVLVAFASAVLLALGLALIAYFGKKLLTSIKASKVENTPTVIVETE